MAIAPKLRPSMTVRELALITDALDKRIISMVAEGNINTSVLLELTKLKTYCESLQPRDSEAERMLAAYLSASNAPVNTEALAIAKATAQTQPSINTEAASVSVSPIDMPELTDDQRYDLLALRPDKQRTPEENKWFLNVGTLVMMRRNGVLKSAVSEGDL